MVPTYDYACKKCGHRFEAFQSMKAKPLKKCPKCSVALQRRISSGAGIIFKGAGFYQTDYRSPKYHEAVKKEVPPPEKKDAANPAPKPTPAAPKNGKES